MKAPMNPVPRPLPAARAGGLRPAQRGLTMILTLIFLGVMTMLGAAMFRGYTLLERVAGNTMDKQRSFEVAQSVLRYGEWWLDAQGSAPLVVTCNGVTDANINAALPVCDSPLPTAGTVPWTAPRITYTPNFMTIAAGGGLSGSGDVNYSSRPELHIHFLGIQSDGVSHVYQLTAAASGGNPATVSVVQSAITLAPPVKDLGTP
jgi:type IV pilus assembly protein PilX